MRQELTISERRACGLVGLARTTLRRVVVEAPDTTSLTARIIPAERFVKFAQSCWWLLNAAEDRRWKYIQSVLRIRGTLSVKQTALLREHYDIFVGAARGEIPESEIAVLRMTVHGG